MKVMTIFGTRPEAIKMCPLILELKKHENIQCQICLTGQHREMLRQVMDCFHLKEDYNLDIMRDNQSLTTITTDILEALAPVLQKEAPDLILVHGDTTTSFAAALAAFYQQIPIGHVEAGLRTGNKYSPFPEEVNRCLVSQLASIHFCPTALNKKNLELENITKNVYITGNTVIDAFKTTVKENYVFKNTQLASLSFTDKHLILVTAHRRENLGKPLENICRALLQIVQEREDVRLVYPVHLNPRVRKTVFRILGNQERVILTEPLDVLDMHNLMAKSYLVMTDSGGLQEEAPSLGKPVLVLRTETERPEAVTAGTVRVVGVEKNTIYKNAMELLNDQKKYTKMAKTANPYGSGIASKTIVNLLLQLFQNEIPERKEEWNQL